MSQSKTKASGGAAGEASANEATTGAVAEFELSKTLRSRLPAPERANASVELWKKSGGKCALCSLPLDLQNKDSIVPDHYIAEAKDGPTTIANLYLAHRTCNASRGLLDFSVAQPLVRFRSLADQKQSLTFDDVIDQYILGKNRLLVEFGPLGKNSATIAFGHEKLTLPLSEDPATGVKYCFVDVPIEFIHNDKEIQPRVIMPGHVRKLALDFLERPVHEPSNCRLVQEEGATARLLQFDGQHKTTAQILIGRRSVPVKIYVEPSIDMLQSLVIKIQQEIKKQPLTKSETLAKIGDVIKRLLDGYKEREGVPRTERGLIALQPKGQQSETKKLYFNELRRIIFFDDENLLSKAVLPGALITTDKVVVDRIIDPLLFSQPLELDMDAGGGRDDERKNILLILNAIAEKMLPMGWDKVGNEVLRRRAESFFLQGSIGWWMGEILVPALRYVLYKIGTSKTPILLDPLDEKAKERVLSLVETMCGWSIWSTDGAEALKAMRSNTVKNVAHVFPEFTMQRLIEETNAKSN